MEEKKVKLSTVIIFLLLIVIIAGGVYIYKLQAKETKISDKSSEDTNTKINEEISNKTTEDKDVVKNEEVTDQEKFDKYMQTYKKNIEKIVSEKNVEESNNEDNLFKVGQDDNFDLVMLGFDGSAKRLFMLEEELLKDINVKDINVKYAINVAPYTNGAGTYGIVDINGNIITQ